MKVGMTKTEQTFAITWLAFVRMALAIILYSRPIQIGSTAIRFEWSNWSRTRVVSCPTPTGHGSANYEFYGPVGIAKN